MKHILVLVGVWASVGFIAGVCLATDPRKPSNQPAAPASPPPAPSTAGSRYAAPANYGAFIDANRRAAEARRTSQAAAANAQQNGNHQHVDRHFPYLPNGYGSSYSPYGYSPYGYMPPGTTPYVLGYDPLTGMAFLYPLGASYSSYYSPFYGYQRPYYRNPYLGFGYPAAVFAPAGQLFGPGPIQQLMGVDQWLPQPPDNANAVANDNANLVGNGNAGNANPGLANNNNNPPAPKPAVPAGGGKAMEIAWKFITFGDAHFGNQKYIDALDRYRRAARECPTLSDAWFRQGFALAALGRYDQAAKSMRRGLEEKPDWIANHFHLSELYGDEKKTLLDNMIKAAEAQPNNADLAYVLGVHLYCDGKPDQAAPFFHRAAQLLGTDADVKSFLARGR